MTQGDIEGKAAPAGVLLVIPVPEGRGCVSE